MLKQKNDNIFLFDIYYSALLNFLLKTYSPVSMVGGMALQKVLFRISWKRLFSPVSL